MGAIEDLKAAIEEQNRLHEESLALEREKTEAQLREVAVTEQHVKLDKELLIEQIALRETIQGVMEVGEQLLSLIPLLSCLGDSQAIILLILELMIQPLYKMMAKEELSNDAMNRMEDAMSQLAKLRNQIHVYGQIQSAGDSNIAGQDINREGDDDG